MSGGDNEKTSRSSGRDRAKPASFVAVGCDRRWVNAQELNFADTGRPWPCWIEGPKARVGEVGGFSGGSRPYSLERRQRGFPSSRSRLARPLHSHQRECRKPRCDQDEARSSSCRGGMVFAYQPSGRPQLEAAMRAEMLEQRAAMLRRINTQGPADARLIAEQRDMAEMAEAASVARFGLRPSNPARESSALTSGATGVGALVYHRKPEPKGPMTAWVSGSMIT